MLVMMLMMLRVQCQIVGPLAQRVLASILYRTTVVGTNIIGTKYRRCMHTFSVPV